MTRLVIVVAGGAVQELYANDTVQVQLLDYDDLDASSDLSAFQRTRERADGCWEPGVVGENDLDRLVREFKEELAAKEAAITKRTRREVKTHVHKRLRCHRHARRLAGRLQPLR